MVYFGAYDEKTNQIGYSIMVQSHLKLPKDQELIEMQIPASTWVIFDCFGPVPQTIHQAWNYLNEEWLMNYPFKHAPFPELEWYSDGNAYGENYLSQIWIPIIEDA